VCPALVLQKGWGNRTLRHDIKIPRFAPLYKQIVIDPECNLIEQNMVIWAKAKNDPCDVGPVVGTTKRLDLSTFQHMSLRAPRIVYSRSRRVSTKSRSRGIPDLKVR